MLHVRPFGFYLQFGSGKPAKPNKEKLVYRISPLSFVRRLSTRPITLLRDVEMNRRDRLVQIILARLVIHIILSVY